MVSTRRRYLRGVGVGSALLVGSAGCLGRDPQNGDGPNGDGLNGDGSGGDGANGTRPEGTGGPGVTIVSVDGLDDFPVSPAVEVVREAATESAPPRLRTVLENTSDETVTVGEGRAVHLEYVSDDSGDLVFLPAEGEFPAEPGCWRLTDTVATTQEYRTIDIDAGGSSERLIDLYATPGEDACLPVGEYRFETTVSIGRPDSEAGPSGTWSLTILLE
ncbi:hypothetical protein [Halorubrum sp. HHNYT27]|uniref:hypothetical protein n=1 Tax=Halorubrum sp. HHNYT27 TaxID=3402275 RepID=UPI003EBBA745